MRRIAVAIAGGLLLAVGTALLVLPGPGIPVIIAGLALLATEFEWARRWLRKARARARYAVARVKARRRHSPG